MIQTKEIELTPSQYFKLLARIRFESSWYVYLLPFVFGGAGLLLFPDQTLIAYTLIVYGLVNPLWLMVYLYMHSTSNKNSHIAIKRHYVIDGGLITAYHKDGSESQFNMNDVIAVRNLKYAHLLYFSRSEFIYLPVDTITSEDMDNLLEQLKELNISVK